MISPGRAADAPDEGKLQMQRWMTRVAILGILAVVCPPADAHFQLLIPSTDMVNSPKEKRLSLDLVFTHPMEGGPAMEMGAPAQFGVLHRGQKEDLLPALEERTVDGKRAYSASYSIAAPGAHVFYLEPAPYWESGEKTMIIHYTKVVVAAFGSWIGWDAMVGFPVEIEPLTRPYGLWTGNAFQGIVRKDGAPVPSAHVEVEYYNRDGTVEIPGDAFVTQVVKTDANGVFTYALPRAGWWGFAALVENDEEMKSPDGEDADVEMGALLWVHAVDMKEKAASGTAK